MPTCLKLEKLFANFKVDHNLSIHAHYSPTLTCLFVGGVGLNKRHQWGNYQDLLKGEGGGVFLGHSRGFLPQNLQFDLSPYN